MIPERIKTLEPDRRAKMQTFHLDEWEYLFAREQFLPVKKSNT